MEIKVPFLKQDIGAGDAIKKVTDRLGVKQCGGCKQRQALANRVTLKGSSTQSGPPRSPWADVEYPNLPDGWRLVSSRPAKDPRTASVNYYESDTGKMHIWQIIDGKYKRGHGFCCGDMRPAVDHILAELCR